MLTEKPHVLMAVQTIRADMAETRADEEATRADEEATRADEEAAARQKAEAEVARLTRRNRTLKSENLISNFLCRVPQTNSIFGHRWCRAGQGVPLRRATMKEFTILWQDL